MIFGESFFYASGLRPGFDICFCYWEGREDGCENL